MRSRTLLAGSCFVLVGLATGCCCECDCDESTVPSEDDVVSSILQSKELQQSAIEALEAFKSTAEDDDIDAAKDLVRESLSLLRDADKDLARCLGSGEITYDEWKATSKELRCARMNDAEVEGKLRAEEDEVLDIDELQNRLEVARECKEVALGFMRS